MQKDETYEINLVFTGGYFDIELCCAEKQDGNTHTHEKII